MRRRILASCALSSVVLLGVTGAPHRTGVPPRQPAASSPSAILWRDPVDIASRDLKRGPGGVADDPQGAVAFLEEDLNGTNPKFTVRDAAGTKWTVKLGDEARPEVVASRLLWAVGYFASEDRFRAELRVENMPPRLERGQEWVGPDGVVRNVRLKRHLEDEKKVGTWQWADNPFTGTVEFDGLRVMMALINNWDLKDDNNAVFEERSEPSVRIYMVSDLGASFGSTGRGLRASTSKGNLHTYSHSRFVSQVTPDGVSFAAPSRPALVLSMEPFEFYSRVRMRWIGRNIPREHVRWMAELLARLSPEQIRDAFRAAGYPPDEVEDWARAVERRIDILARL